MFYATNITACLLYCSLDVPPSKKIKMESDQPMTSTKYVLKSLPIAIGKAKDQDVPLPNPFPLPKNFRSDVAAALATCRMTSETDRQFLSDIASSIFKYKKYPTKEDLIDVANCIIAKYPFMKAAKGKPYVSQFEYLEQYTVSTVFLYINRVLL